MRAPGNIGNKNHKFDIQTSAVKPLSVVRSLFMKPLRTTQIPSAVSRVKTSNLLTMGAEENTRTGCPLKQTNKKKTWKSAERKHQKKFSSRFTKWQQIEAKCEKKQKQSQRKP